MFGNLRSGNANLMQSNDVVLTSQIVQGVNNTANLQKTDTKAGIGVSSQGIDLKMIIIGIAIIMILKKV